MKDKLDYQRILVAIDFSPSSEAALKQANWLSRQSGASLVLEHTLFEMDRSRSHSHLSFGTPWKEIDQMVQHHHVDLIAMGTVGRSGVKGLFWGSTVEKVLDNCDCSILTTKPDGFVSPIEPLQL